MFGFEGVSVSSPSITASVSASIAAKVPKGFKSGGIDDAAPKFFHCLIYGHTGAYKTVTAAQFGGPDRTLIIGTRDIEQYKIPLEGKGYHSVVLAHDISTFKWAIMNPEAAADAAGFPEWKDREDRVLVVDDWTEGALMLVEDNETNDEGKEIKDGRKIYGAVNEDVRALLNSLKRKRMHVIFTALVNEDDWTIYPAMSKGTAKFIEAAFDYVFYMDKEFKKMKTEPFSVPYPAKDQFGKDVTRLRQGFAKSKVPRDLSGKLLAKDEPMDLAALWAKVTK
jgi:hypothetical protein